METFTIPMQSAAIGELTKALSQFQGSVKQPKLNKTVTVTLKDGKGKYNFKYADLGACMAAAAPLLMKNGLAVIQTIQGQSLVTTLSHQSGEFVNSQMPLNQQTLFSVQYQSIGSMITYLKRYAYCAILGLVADDDDDANAAVGNQVQYHGGEQASARHQASGRKAGITGAQLKGFVSDINSKQSIDELMAYWQSIIQDYPEMKDNQTLSSALFQRCSSIGIEELTKCSTADDIDLLIDRWNEIWPAVIGQNTPFGNAIVEKRKTLAA